MKRMMVALALVLLVMGCVTPNGHETPPGETEQNTPPVREDWQTTLHNTYGITEKEIFEQLPPKPGDFDEWNAQWKTGTVEWLDDVPYEVYAQPEFYPTFETTGKKTWTNAPNQPAVTIGIATTPAEQTSVIQEGETTIDTTLFISSAWGATQYQGMKLTYSVQPDANIAIQFEPEELMVGPAFPQLDANWAQKVHVTGIINAEKGKTYTIRIMAVPPTYKTAIKWSNEQPTYENVSPFFASSDGIATLSLIPTP